jgi:hypothetical protein
MLNTSRRLTGCTVNNFTLASFARLLLISAFLGQLAVGDNTLIVVEEISFTLEEPERDDTTNVAINVNPSINFQNFIPNSSCRCISYAYLAESLVLHKTGPPIQA